MSEKEKKYNQIEKYLSGQLQGSELQRFETELLNNSSLKEEVNLHKEIAEAVTEKEVMVFRKSVNSIIKNETTSQRWSYLGIAATILIIISAGIGINTFFFKKDSIEQLYTAYYEPYEDLISVRSDETLNESISTLMNYYNQQKYGNAISYLDSIEIYDQPLLQLYVGISYLNVSAFDKAHETFDIISNDENVFNTEANWYNALTYLREGNKGKTIFILSEIANSKKESNYKLKALELLDKLN